MGCVSCAQKYAALKAFRQKSNVQAPADANSPRKVGRARRGVIRKSEVVEPPQIKQEEENAHTNSTD